MFLDWFTILQTRFSATPCINLYPTTACDAKNDNRKQNTIASYATKMFGIEYQGFYCVFVRTEIDLIAFSGPRNCVNTQYAALSGAMVLSALHLNISIYVVMRLSPGIDLCFATGPGFNPQRRQLFFFPFFLSFLLKC